jgi:signal transduction histidine kinase
MPGRDGLEAFFTTKDAGHGIGLGLAVVRRIVEKHQGTIVVDNHPGHGVTFAVRLPAVPDAGAPMGEG